MSGDFPERRPLRVVVLDRGVTNPYSLGMVSGLNEAGVETLLGGPVGGPPDVVPMYPRYGIRGRRLRKLWELPGALLKGVMTLYAFDPDVVHLQWSDWLDVAYAAVVSTARRGRIVLTVHSPATSGAAHKRQAWLLARASAVIVLGDVVAAQLRAAHPRAVAPISVVPHGNYEHVVERFPRRLARQRLGLDGDRPVLAFVGQIRPRKGIETFFHAAAELRDQLNAQLLVVGAAIDTDYRLQLGRLERELGISVSWIESHDQLPQQTLDLAASAATALVLPFNSAAQSGSVLFGMTHGRCVISTTVGEVPATLGDFGILVPPCAPDALASALRAVLADPDDADVRGERAREYVLRELGWRRVAERTVHVYDAVCGRAEGALSAGELAA